MDYRCPYAVTRLLRFVLAVGGAAVVGMPAPGVSVKGGAGSAKKRKNCRPAGTRKRPRSGCRAAPPIAVAVVRRRPTRRSSPRSAVTSPPLLPPHPATPLPPFFRVLFARLPPPLNDRVAAATVAAAEVAAVVPSALLPLSRSTLSTRLGRGLLY